MHTIGVCLICFPVPFHRLWRLVASGYWTIVCRMEAGVRTLSPVSKRSTWQQKSHRLWTQLGHCWDSWLSGNKSRPRDNRHRSTRCNHFKWPRFLPNLWWNFCTSPSPSKGPLWSSSIYHCNLWGQVGANTRPRGWLVPPPPPPSFHPWIWRPLSGVYYCASCKQGGYNNFLL